MLVNRPELVICVGLEEGVFSVSVDWTPAELAAFWSRAIADRGVRQIRAQDGCQARITTLLRNNDQNRVVRVAQVYGPFWRQSDGQTSPYDR